MLKFTKMEGIGNDYIYIDAIHQKVPTDTHFIQSISAYHTGIGSDGVVLILPSQSYDFKMRIFNRDGSEAKMCGNGIRCFTKFVYDHHLTSKTYLEIETLSGVRKVWMQIENKQVTSVTVDMQKPTLNPQTIPCSFQKDQMINEPIIIQDQCYHLTAVSMGNPHVVMFVDDLDFDIREIGPQLENHKMFPDRVNVEFVQVMNDSYLKMRVWERGSEETMACGTGACAAMYASYLNNKCHRHVCVELLGGILDITYKEDGHIYMTGPARTVFEGYINEKEYRDNE